MDEYDLYHAVEPPHAAIGKTVTAVIAAATIAFKRFFILEKLLFGSSSQRLGANQMFYDWRVFTLSVIMPHA